MSTIARPVVFSDVLPKVKLREVVLVLAAVVTTSLLAQLEINVGFLPEAIVGTTLAVLLTGATLGSRLGAIAMATYAAVGLVLPVYAGGEQGTRYLFGDNGGFIIGAIAAAFVVGLLAERSQDRSVLTAIPTMLFGAAIVATTGIIWSVLFSHTGSVAVIEDAVAPHIAGEALVAVAAGLVLPLLWKFTTNKKASVEA